MTEARAGGPPDAQGAPGGAGETGKGGVVHRIEEATEVYGYPARGPLVLTVEHASNRVPSPLRPSEADHEWLQTHWGWDIGARTATRAIVRHTGSVAVMARFSRLVCDPNRDPADPTWIRTEIEGQPLAFNQGAVNGPAADRERERRRGTFHEPYHATIDRTLTERLLLDREVLLLSLHSFTPVWNNRVRTMDAGVLYAHHDAVAERFALELRREGLTTALNEPYSARDGLAYSVERHGRTHGVVFLELELNQAILCTPARALRVAGKVASALTRLHLRGAHRA